MIPVTPARMSSKVTSKPRSLGAVMFRISRWMGLFQLGLPVVSMSAAVKRIRFQPSCTVVL